MSREIQERSDKVIKELKESLLPLTKEIKKIKTRDNPKKY